MNFTFSFLVHKKRKHAIHRNLFRAINRICGSGASRRNGEREHPPVASYTARGAAVSCLMFNLDPELESNFVSGKNVNFQIEYLEGVIEQLKSFKRINQQYYNNWRDESYHCGSQSRHRPDSDIDYDNRHECRNIRLCLPKKLVENPPGPPQEGLNEWTPGFSRDRPSSPPEPNKPPFATTVVETRPSPREYTTVKSGHEVKIDTARGSVTVLDGISSEEKLIKSGRKNSVGKDSRAATLYRAKTVVSETPFRGLAAFVPSNSPPSDPVASTSRGESLGEVSSESDVERIVADIVTSTRVLSPLSDNYPNITSPREDYHTTENITKASLKKRTTPFAEKGGGQKVRCFASLTEENNAVELSIPETSTHDSGGVSEIEVVVNNRLYEFVDSVPRNERENHYPTTTRSGTYHRHPRKERRDVNEEFFTRKYSRSLVSAPPKKQNTNNQVFRSASAYPPRL